MEKLRRRRSLIGPLAAAALVSLALTSGSAAWAAEGEAGQPGTEAPASGTGWTAPEGGGETPASGGGDVVNGSALGSGGSRGAPSPPLSPPPSEYTYEPPSTETPPPSTEEEETETTEATGEETTATTAAPLPKRKPEPREHVPAAARGGAVTLAPERQGVAGVSASSEEASSAAAPAAALVDDGGSGFGQLQIILLVLGLLTMVLVGLRLLLGPFEPSILGRRSYRPYAPAPRSRASESIARARGRISDALRSVGL